MSYPSRTGDKFLYVLGSDNTFLNWLRAQESTLGKLGGIVLTTDGTYKQTKNRDTKTITFGTVDVAQQFFLLCQSICTHEDEETLSWIINSMKDHTEKLVKQVQEKWLHKVFEDAAATNVSVLGELFGFDADANLMRDLRKILDQIVALDGKEWKANVDFLIVDGQKAPRNAAIKIFPNCRMLDCFRHLKL